MSSYVWGEAETQFFYQLSPDMILDSIDRVGLRSTGRVLTLNSMENRVFEIEIEPIDQSSASASDHFVIGKYYRPGRWSEKQIREEHQFLLDLAEAEMPVIAPLQFAGETLFKLEGHAIFYAIFPKKGGRPADEMNKTQLERMGRTLARLHMIGASKPAPSRLQMTPYTFGEQNISFLMQQNFIPSALRESFEQVARRVVSLMTPLFEGVALQRIHGDCHLGNVIVRDDTPYLIDFDDMVMGPRVQDIWLQIPGIDEESVERRNILLDAYEEIIPFDYSQLKLIEPLRTLRYLHFAAWIGKRYEDATFQHAFPHYLTEQYWSTLIYDLLQQEQIISEYFARLQGDSYY